MLCQFKICHSTVTITLWNHHRDEVNNDANENNCDKYRMNNNNITTIKCFESKAKTIGTTPDDINTLHTVVVVH